MKKLNNNLDFTLVLQMQNKIGLISFLKSLSASTEAISWILVVLDSNPMVCKNYETKVDYLKLNTVKKYFKITKNLFLLQNLLRNTQKVHNHFPQGIPQGKIFHFPIFPFPQGKKFYWGGRSPNRVILWSEEKQKKFYKPLN